MLQNSKFLGVCQYHGFLASSSRRISHADHGSTCSERRPWDRLALSFGRRKSRARQGARDDAEMLTRALTNERHLSEVREAIEYALAASFVSAPKEEAVKTIEEVLRAVAAPQRFQVSEEDKVKASHFFKELLRQLTDR